MKGSETYPLATLGVPIVVAAGAVTAAAWTGAAIVNPTMLVPLSAITRAAIEPLAGAAPVVVRAPVEAFTARAPERTL